MPISVSQMTAAHWADVSRIYQDGINTGQATFAIAPPASWDEWCGGKINSCSLVARDEDRHEIVGWAALSPVSSRAVYAGVAEVSVYVGAPVRGQGVGSGLLQEQELTALEFVDLLRKWSILLHGERSRRTGSRLCLGLSVDLPRPGRE
jgi:L-amino acid N-acyltransferase YncA